MLQATDKLVHVAARVETKTVHTCVELYVYRISGYSLFLCSLYEGIKKAESKLNERIRMIERSNKEPAEKRDLIQQIQKQKDLIARRAF